MKNEKIKIKKSCRVCSRRPLTQILSLGELYISDFLDPGKEHLAEKAPLDLVLCESCGLLQLKHTVSHESLYRNYWYRSGVNKTMTVELKNITEEAEKIVSLKSGDFVLDIGSNDGTLLRSYTVPGLKLVGFEPARNIVEKYGREGVDKIFVEFFNFPAWQKEFGDKKAKVITAIAMFYDLDDPNTFVADVVRCLDKEGLFIIQMAYLPLMLERNAFDGICHEHLEYYSLLSLENLLMRHGLEVFNVELRDINEGSFRAYIRHKGWGKSLRISEGAEERVKQMREAEAALNLLDKKVYLSFAKRVDMIRDKIKNFIESEVRNGKKIYVYGASTKGNTLLQYFGLDNRLIVAAAERNPDKWGKRTVGTNIPIISEEQARAEKPDYFLVLPWHFIKEFMEREKEFLKNGGKFIVPLPEFRIIGKEEIGLK
jgi:NDP-4-keto-2,6-dideoxyhexose 3-C-methyltransferase